MDDYQDAFLLLDQLIREKITAYNTPGLAIALTNRKTLLWQANYGFANLDTQAPLTDDTLFEIGSIGKSFTCLALLKLHERGQLDLHAPVNSYLPWLDLLSDFEPITPHHLMTHTAGLHSGIDFTPCARYEVWALRQEALPYAPGHHFSYSNVGYKLLGFLLEEVTGRPYGDLLQEWILAPLKMDDSDALTTHESRRRLAVGYERFYDDRPWHSSHPLVPAPWLEYGGGDGSPVCTAVDLTAYLRLLLNQGKSKHGQLFSKESIQLMLAPHTPARGDHYGYGLYVKERNGRTYFGHNGGTVGYLATMLGDLDAGNGVIIFTNGPADSEKDAIAEYALNLLFSVQAGNPPPEPAPTLDPTQNEDAAAYAGLFTHPTQKPLRFTTKGGQLILNDDNENIFLEKRGEDRFFANQADLALHLLSFKRDSGRVVAVGHGQNVYVKADSDWAPNIGDYPGQWNAYPGHYRAHNPWFTNFRVFLRGGQLFMSYKVYQHDFEDRLLPLADDLFQLGEEKTPNRIRFDTIVDGQALRANVFGGDYYRYFTP